MTGVTMTAIVPRRFLRDPRRFERAINNALDGTALAVKADFGATVATWRNKPRFTIRSRIGERVISTDGVVYRFVSGGTRPHLIRAKTPAGLAFYRTGFRAKTRVRKIVSYKGQAANKDFTRPQVVRHPGIAAREYPQVLQEKYTKLFPKTLQRAIDAEC